MPIAVVCPKCAAKINAPDTTAGKRVKCPKFGCGAAITVPAPEADVEAEAIEDEPAPAPPAPAKKKAVAVAEPDDEDDEEKPTKPKKKRAVVEEDDDADEDDKPRKKTARAAEVDEEEDEKPAKKNRAAKDEDEDNEEDEDEDKPKKKKKQKKGGLPPVAIALIAVAALCVFGAVGFGIYEATKKKPEETTNNSKGGPPVAPPASPIGGPKQPGPGPGPGGNTPKSGGIPAGWAEYRSNEDKFKMMMPKGVVKDMDKDDHGYIGADKAAGWFVVVGIKDIPQGASPQERKKLEDDSLKDISKDGGQEISRERVQFAGCAATEIVMEIKDAPQEDGTKVTLRGVIRVFLTDARVYVVIVGGKLGTDIRKETKAISDTFQLLK